MNKVTFVSEYPIAYEPSFGIVFNGRFYGWFRGIKWAYKNRKMEGIKSVTTDPFLQEKTLLKEKVEYLRKFAEWLYAGGEKAVIERVVKDFLKEKDE